MGRVSVAISDELEKQLRFKTIERFGGKKGDLSKAVEEAIETWVTKQEEMLLKRGKNNRDAYAPHYNLAFGLVYSGFSLCMLETSIE
jgi:hypothetical protein